MAGKPISEEDYKSQSQLEVKIIKRLQLEMHTGLLELGKRMIRVD